MHKLSHQIIKEYDIICVEKLDIKSMQKNKQHTKSIHDVSWFKFIQMLEYKAKLYHKKLIKVDTYYPSSQRCSNCGYINKNMKDLSVREWQCPICYCIHDRDLNAAKNILNEGLKKIKYNTVGGMEIYACGDENSMKQEASSVEPATQVSRET